MNHSRKIAAWLTIIAILFSFASCSMRETYDTDQNTVLEDSDDAPELTVAEKKNTVGVDDGTNEVVPAPPVSVTEETEEVTLVITGDIKLTESMINDARAQATEGKEYSFLRMYTGVYRSVNDADIAVGGYSALGQPYGTESEYEPPEEHLDALASVGFDVLDISGMGSDYTLLNERGIEGVSSAEDGDDAIRLIEKNDIKFAFISAGFGENVAQSCTDNDFLSRLEYADFLSDVLVVLVHWDEKMTDAEKTDVAKSLADHGAAIVVGDGESIEEIETISAENGTLTIVAYSIGNLMSDASEACDLCSGMLTVKFTRAGKTSAASSLTFADTLIVPAFVHYTKKDDGTKGDYSLYRVEDYTNELAQAHAAEVDVDGLRGYVKNIVASGYLSEYFK